MALNLEGTKTEKNLEQCIAGENMEWTDMYVRFAPDAGAEGFGVISKFFTGLADIEKGHEMRYRKLLEAPKGCPVCAHPLGYFKALVEMAA